LIIYTYKNTYKIAEQFISNTKTSVSS
jgi:hypothetical protein